MALAGKYSRLSAVVPAGSRAIEPGALLERREVTVCYWCGHCPHCGRSYAEQEYPAPWYRYSRGPRRPAPEEDYAERLEEERDALERRLRRLEAQLAELQKAGRPG